MFTMLAIRRSALASSPHAKSIETITDPGSDSSMGNISALEHIGSRNYQRPGNIPLRNMEYKVDLSE